MSNINTKNFLKIVFIIFLLFIYFIINTITLDCQVNQQDMQEQAIYIAIFSEPGCHDCERAKKILEEIVFQYPQIEIRDFDISTPEGVALAEQLGEFYQVSEYDRLLVPLIYIGDRYFLREQISYENIINYIEEIEGKEFLPPWQKVEEDQSSVQNRLIERFRSFGIGAIAVSGLIDGVNPCAFATIIFFISYLTLINRKGKELLLVGGMFTLAVFITYFLIGTGALKIVTSLSILPVVRKIFVFVMAAVSAVLAFISLSDYLKFKKTGQPCEATLQLPERMKKMIHSTIRKNVKTRNFVIMAAATGFLVSVLELACTGQIYLPTLIFISNVPELRTNALLYLLVYNLMFVIPLIMVFLFTYWGTSSQQWTDFSKKNFGKMKLLMTFVFSGLAIILIVTGLVF
jgi:glutaredoxin